MDTVALRLAAALCLLATPGAAFAQPKPPAEPPPTPNAALVETVRLLAGETLYHIHRKVGLVTEARFYGLREAGELSHELGVTIRSLKETEQQLEKVAALKGLAKEDAAAVTRLKKIAGLMREQCESLSAYFDTGVADHWEAAETARKAAWKDLEDLLELKKGVAPPPREPGKKKP